MFHNHMCQELYFSLDFCIISRFPYAPSYPLPPPDTDTHRQNRSGDTCSPEACKHGYLASCRSGGSPYVEEKCIDRHQTA